jgi:addiction module HigA family antidote
MNSNGGYGVIESYNGGHYNILRDTLIPEPWVRMTSRSQTTTKGPPPHARRRESRGGGRRLPRRCPPTHPGEMLLEEFLRPLGVSQSAFAKQMGISFPRLNEIIRGKRTVTSDTALRLERVLGMPADFWLGLQIDWDLWHAMRGSEAAVIARLRPLPIAS